MLSINSYRQKSILFIGPGVSKSYIDMDQVIKDADYTASLNDVVLDYLTDFYFVGEKFIYDYVEKKATGDFFNKTEKVFLALHKKHDKRIDEDYFKDKKRNNTFTYTESIRELQDNYEYNLPFVRKFEKKNIRVLSNLLNNFPYNKWKYIRSRTLSNSLQVLYNLGFSEVRLIGFMDSFKFSRANYENQQGYLKEAKKTIKKISSLQSRTDQQLKNSFEYQEQILRTIDHIYNKDNRHIYNLCPKEKSPQHILDYKKG